MAKLFSFSKIILPPDDKHPEERLILKGKVFDATPEQAKQFDAIKAARPATKEEIEAAKEEEAIANGTAFVAPAPSDSVVEDNDPVVASTAAGDPKAVPKGKSA